MKQDNTDRYLSWSTLALEQGLPGAVVDRDALRANVETLYRLAQGKPIRVVTKSVRCPALLRWIMDTLGTHCAGLMAYHPNEAALLAEQFPEARILVAYPNTDPLHLARVCSHWEGADITLMVDDHAQLMPLRKPPGMPPSGFRCAWIWICRPAGPGCISAYTARHCVRWIRWFLWPKRWQNRPAFGFGG